MDIIREKPSRNGILDCQVFHNVSGVRKIDNYRTNKWGRKQVIQIIYEDNRVFPIMFPCTDLRDKALATIESATSVVVLDFNEYFSYKVLKDSKVRQIVKFNLLQHLQKCIQEIFKHEQDIDVADLRTRDAFNNFTSVQLQLLRDGEVVDIKESQLKPLTWAKTLNVPKSILDQGVTPLQFFTTLIENEKNIICTRQYADSV